MSETPTLAEAKAKRQAADDAYAQAKQLIADGRTKRAEGVVVVAQDLEAEADQLELQAWRALWPLFDEERGEYQCPNGHAFPQLVEVKCEHCEASVACVPAAALIEAGR